MFSSLTTRRLAVCAAAIVALSGCSGSDKTTAGTGDEELETTTTTAPIGLLTSTSDIQPGQCFNEVPDPAQQPYAVFIVECNGPHRFEAYAKTYLELGEPAPEGAPYPGTLTVANAAEAQCITGFTSYVGIAWEASEYDVQVWWPSKESWETTNDRAILCGLYRVTADPETGMTEGLARNSGR